MEYSIKFLDMHTALYNYYTEQLRELTCGSSDYKMDALLLETKPYNFIHTNYLYVLVYYEIYDNVCE